MRLRRMAIGVHPKMMPVCNPPEPGRFDAAPWFRWVYSHVPCSNESACAGLELLSDVDIARRYNIPRTSLHVGRKRGLTPDMADRWAVRVGLHPSLLWPEYFDDVPPTLEGTDDLSDLRWPLPA